MGVFKYFMTTFVHAVCQAWANFFFGPTSDLDFGSISFCACALSASTFEPTNFDLQAVIGLPHNAKEISRERK